MRDSCTECAAPRCHRSCDLFDRGVVGRCKRFVDGIVVHKTDNSFTYEVEALFKPWGQIICCGNTWCVDEQAYKRWAPWIPRLGHLAFLLQCFFRPLPATMHWWITDKLRGLGNRLPRLLNKLAFRPGQPLPTRLIAIIGNPQHEPVDLELSLSGFGDSQEGRSLRRTFSLKTGWNVICIPAEEINPVVDLRKLYRFCLVPLVDSPVLLQFAYMGFVYDGRRKPVKLLVVDLDNTLWSGILVETPDKLFSLLPGIRETLEMFDRRGILLSVASKNNEVDAKAVLERLGLWDYFLYPQINWEPKSAGIRRIVASLNIGLDAVAFVDDSEFERAEVASSLPEVRTYDATELACLGSRSEFDVPVTDESKDRRALYRQEGRRNMEFERSSVDYDTFLVSCRMRLILERLTDTNRERVFELVQRTNQLNYSGRHYMREELQRLVGDSRLVPVVMRCEDRFGNYGIVGFSLLERTGSDLKVRDLMLSCRVQGKRVEHGCFAYLVSTARRVGLKQLVCCFTRTSRNAPAARVFADMGFAVMAVDGSNETYQLGIDCPPPKIEWVVVQDDVDLASLLSLK